MTTALEYQDRAVSPVLQNGLHTHWVSVLGSQFAVAAFRPQRSESELTAPTSALRHPYVRRMIADSPRHWVAAMRVCGFAQGAGTHEEAAQPRRKALAT